MEALSEIAYVLWPSPLPNVTLFEQSDKIYSQWREGLTCHNFDMNVRPPPASYHSEEFHFLSIRPNSEQNNKTRSDAGYSYIFQ